jgi:hypothetical protein
MGKILIEKMAVAPNTPSAGKSVVYVKSDGAVYTKSDLGVESKVLDSVTALLSNIPGTLSELQLDPAIIAKINAYTAKFNVAVTNPTATNDASEGYAIGSIWINPTLGKIFVATTVLPGNATWVDVSLKVSELANVAVSGSFSDLFDTTGAIDQTMLNSSLDSILAKVNQVNAYTKSQLSVVSVLADVAGTVTWDLTASNVATFTFGTADVTVDATNIAAAAGGRFILTVQQDSVGSRLITWDAAIKWQSVPTLSTGANAVDVFEFLCDGTNLYGRVFGSNFS